MKYSIKSPAKCKTSIYGLDGDLLAMLQTLAPKMYLCLFVLHKYFSQKSFVWLIFFSQKQNFLR